MTKKISEKILLENVRIVWPYLFEKEPISEYIETEEQRRFKVDCLLSKSNPKHMEYYKKINDIADDVLRRIKVKKHLYELFKDGDEIYKSIDDSTEQGKEKKANCEYLKGHYILNVKNKIQPKLSLIKGQLLNTEVDENPFYPGCFVHILFTIDSYEFKKVPKGVTKRLQHVLFARDGEMLGGKIDTIDASEDFNKIQDDEDIF